MALEMLGPLENLATVRETAGENLAARVVWVARDTTTTRTLRGRADDGGAVWVESAGRRRSSSVVIDHTRGQGWNRRVTQGASQWVGGDRGARGRQVAREGGPGRHGGRVFRDGGQAGRVAVVVVHVSLLCVQVVLGRVVVVIVVDNVA